MTNLDELRGETERLQIEQAQQEWHQVLATGDLSVPIFHTFRDRISDEMRALERRVNRLEGTPDADVSELHAGHLERWMQEIVMALTSLKSRVNALEVRQRQEAS